MLSSAQDYQALELMCVGQAVALEAVEELESLALLLRITLGLISMAHGAGARAQQCAELSGAGAHARRPGVALEALKAQALMLRSTLAC